MLAGYCNAACECYQICCQFSYEYIIISCLLLNNLFSNILMTSFLTPILQVSLRREGCASVSMRMPPGVAISVRRLTERRLLGLRTWTRRFLRAELLYFPHHSMHILRSTWRPWSLLILSLWTPTRLGLFLILLGDFATGRVNIFGQVLTILVPFSIMEGGGDLCT